MPSAPFRRPAAPGFALLETLAAVLVVSFGLLMLGRAQLHVWNSVDFAREQSEALALAQNDLEQQRERAAADPGQEALGAAEESELTLGATTYRPSRTLEPDPTLPLAALGALVRWQDRDGIWHRLSLHTLLPRLDRRASGWLATAPDSTGPAMPPGRSLAAAVGARLLDDGRTVLKPRADQPDVWIIDPADGRIVAVCTAPVSLRQGQLHASDLSACRSVDARLLSGWIGYTRPDGTPTAREAEHPDGPVLPTDLRLTPGSPAPAEWRCLAGDGNEPHPEGTLAYWCLVQPSGTPATWSGRLDLVPLGWNLSGADNPPAEPGSTPRRVCRYSADRNGNGRIDNLEHPATYLAVQGALPQQNFLVIPATADCPVDGPAQLEVATFNATDDTTVAHQP